MKVLVTGATGFIGTHLMHHLMETGRDDLVGTFRDENKRNLFYSQKIEMRFADLSKPDSLKGITKDVDVVIHLAGLMRFHESWDALYTCNVEATQIIGEEAIKNGISHFIYVSSTEATGPVQVVPGDETSPYTPTYRYGKTKQISELWLREKEKETGFPVTILRPTGVYGPGDRYVTLSTVRAIAQRKLRILPGKGSTNIHFTYVDDIVQGIQKTLDTPKKSIGETFILASDDYLSYKEMFTTIARLLEIPPPTRSVPLSIAKAYLMIVEWRNKRKGRDDFVMHSSLAEDMKTQRAYSNKKAKNMLGFHPQYSFEEGMKKTIQWYQEQHLISG